MPTASTARQGFPPGLCVLLATALLVCPRPALAQNFAQASEQPSDSPLARTLPEGENGRFVFHKSGEDVVRLDSRTGQVSFCAYQPAGWACRPAPEERTALEHEIARLQIENGLLKKELLTRGLALPGHIRAESPARDGKAAGKETSKPNLDFKLPDDSDLERLMVFLERAWRSLAGKIAELQRDYLGKSDGSRP